MSTKFVQLHLCTQTQPKKFDAMHPEGRTLRRDLETAGSQVLVGVYNFG